MLMGMAGAKQTKQLHLMLEVQRACATACES